MDWRRRVALEVGGHHRLQLIHHAQPPLHFRHDPRLLGERGKWDWKALDAITADVWKLRSSLASEQMFDETVRVHRHK